MSLVSLEKAETPSPWVTGEGRSLQIRKSLVSANSAGVGVVSTSGRYASNKRGEPSR